jgi:hypothetical protein
VLHHFIMKNIVKYSARHLIRLVSCLILSLGITAFAAPCEVGKALAPFSAKDQHEQPFEFKSGALRYLLVSHDMDTGKRANAALHAAGADYLPSKRAAYLANIYGMPGIGRAFALPKMRKYCHRIILGDDAELITRFPEQTGKVTVLTLDGDKVTAIRFWTPESEPIDSLLK